jgi:hypothetical protein
MAPNYLHVPGCHAERLLDPDGPRRHCDPFTRARWARRHLTSGEIVKRVTERRQPAPVDVGWNSLAEELFRAKVEVVK